ncbi:MAG: hydroxyacid dehydrogenase [Chloroflexi bacterium]|nr:hydroxyacid dehydrogenase [Chloroflexota bacterium]
MNRVLIVFPDTPESVIELLRRETQVSGPIDASDDWESALRNVEAVIATAQPQFTRQVMDQAPRLRVIGRPGIGVDNVDVEAATARGVCIVNTPDAPTQPVVEKVIGWMLALSHRLFPADQIARVPQWQGRSALMGNDLAGKTLGLIGTGRVGSRIAQICSNAFGMRVIAFDPYANVERVKQFNIELIANLDEMIPLVDFLSVNCPLTSETRGLIDERRLRMLKPTAFLINSARAPVVDEMALAQVLEEKCIAGAALDVFNVEPPPLDHPLLKLDNALLAPHLGSFTQEAMLRMLMQTAEQVVQVFRGQRPVNLVNADVWENRKK